MDFGKLAKIGKEGNLRDLSLVQQQNHRLGMKTSPSLSVCIHVPGPESDDPVGVVGDVPCGRSPRRDVRGGFPVVPTFGLGSEVFR